MREAPNLPPRSAPPPTSGRRSGRVTDRIMTEEMRQRARPRPFLVRILEPHLNRITDNSSRFVRMVNPDDVRIRLLRAGFPMGMRTNTFLLVKFFATIFGALLFFAEVPVLNIILLQPFYGFTIAPIYWPLAGAIGAIYGFKMPDIWLATKIRQRQFAIQMALPDMIDLISVSVEAGLGLIAAIQRISERFNNPLSEEFLRTLQEVRLGRPQADALRDMARRVDVSDLSTLLTSIVQAELLGLAVANVLRVQSDRLRERRAQRAREAAQKAPIKMTFPLVLFIFPALFVVILGPALLKIFNSSLGQ